jgi:capsular exopolysaccharide synthesis family protein
MDEAATQGFDYARFARRTLRARWVLILALFALVLVPGGIAVYTTSPKLYEASATLFFEEPKSENSLLRGMLPLEETALNLAILRSRSLAQGVIDVLPRESKEDLLKRTWWSEHKDRALEAVGPLLGLSVAAVTSPQEQALGALQGRMSVSAAKDGTVLVTAIAFSPRVAAELANTYVDVLLARTGSQARDQARTVREMLENLQAQTKKSLNEAEESLRRFQRTGGEGIAVSDQSRLEVTKLAELENALAEVQVAKEIASSRLAYLRGESQKGGKAPAAAAPAPPPPARIPGADPVQAQRDRLGELEAKLAALGEKYTDKHPLVVATKAEVDEAQARLRQALRGHQEPRPGGAVVVAPAERSSLTKQMADLEVELATLQAREESLKQRGDRARRALSFTSGREQNYTQLMRTVEGQRNLFGLYGERLNQARMSEQNQIRNIRVVDLASVPLSPSSKSRLRSMVLVVVAGLGLGVAAAVALEYVYEVVETDDDVARITGLPVLGSIPVVNSRPANPNPLNLREATPPRSIAIEATRAMATTLELSDGHDKLRTLMIASAGAGEGKTTTLLNLGETLAEMGRRVMLVDADLRRPALHRALRLSNEIGLSDVLGPARIELAEVARRLDDWLVVVPAGAPPANPGALLGSKQLRALLTTTRDQADVVLFDSAPILAVADDLPLAAVVDGVILVVRSGVTQRRSLLRATARLAKVNAPIVGVVVNGLSPREARRHYAAYTAYVSAPPERDKPRRRLWSRWGGMSSPERERKES